MPISDKKKAQTLINAAADEALTIANAANRLESLRTLYQTANVDPTGTPLDGNVTAVSTWIDSIRAVADDPVTVNMIAAKVPTHKGEAL